MLWSAALLVSLLASTVFAATATATEAPQAQSDVDDPTMRSFRSRGLAAVVTQADCGGGTYSVVNSPDGAAISVLFDSFAAQGSQPNGGVVRTNCAVRIPLNLPAGYSLGVFRMDYRGFARLAPGQSAQLSVDYGVGRRARGRNFRRGLRGAYDGDFAFAENIGAGLTRRAGCGEDAALNLNAALDLQKINGSPDALITLDSVDGSARRGVVFYVDLRKCRI